MGSLIPRKGVDLIVAALIEGCGEKSWKLKVVGSGIEEKNLRDMVEHGGIGERVEFISSILPGDVAECFVETDILVQASYREGRPNTVLEALAAGVAVIGSDIDGINELIEHGENGLLFSPGNTRELTQHLQLLIDSYSLRNQLGKAGRQTLLTQGLTWPNCASQYMERYRNLLQEDAV